jgi:hypothetical protein
MLRGAACAAVACVLAASDVRLRAAAQGSQPDRRNQARLDEALKREGDALLALTDLAMSGAQVPSDFRILWTNDFFKARPGAFVPFTLTVERLTRPSPGALIYLRVVPVQGGRVKGVPVAFAYETIFSADPELLTEQPFRVRRGFAVMPGRYTVYLAVRERPADLLGRTSGPRRASVHVQDLEVPDFWTDGLTTSTVMLADRVEQLTGSPPPGGLEEDPYLVGASRIHPATAPVFRRGGELIVVFLIYNPSVGPDKHFDVQVDYHLYRKLRDGEAPGDIPPGRPARPGERYVTRTNPQRFNPSMMGAYFDPAGGQPVLAGQGILLSGFEAGEYRLGITVTDLLSAKTVSRDVAFTVIGS